MADATGAGDVDGTVAVAVAVAVAGDGDGAVAVVGVALMGSAGCWLPFVRSLGRLVALCLRLSALPTGHLSWQRTGNLTTSTTTTRTVDKQSAAKLSSWKDHFKQAPSAGYLSPAPTGRQRCPRARQLEHMICLSPSLSPCLSVSLPLCLCLCLAI